MIVLGIHDGHDSSVALIKNGEIVYAAQEERFTNLKGDYGYPKNAKLTRLKATKTKLKDMIKLLSFKIYNPYFNENKKKCTI